MYVFVYVCGWVSLCVSIRVFVPVKCACAASTWNLTSTGELSRLVYTAAEALRVGVRVLKCVSVCVCVCVFV